MSHVFLDYTYRDLSIESNRRLFIDADGKSASGQSSLSPILYLPMDNPADPGRNAGTGGDFTLNGIVARSGRGPNQYNTVASTFDGANDYLSKAAVTGMSDSKVLNVSFNFNMQSPSAGNILTLYNGGGVSTFQVGIDLFGGQWRMNIQGKSSSTEILFAIIGLSRNFVNDRWQNYSISLDMANTSNRLVYIDGVDYTSNVTWYTYTNAALNITNKSEVMRESSNYVGGRLSALWFNPTYIDLSADNPFYDTETNSPKDLGASGELPTGSSPLIYLPLRANDAGNNLGTGGDFTVNSGPYVGARGPSEFIARSVITGSDGANLSSTGTNLSLADTNTITVAFAVKTDGIASQIYTFNGGGPFSIQNSPSNVLSIAFTLKNSTRYTLTSSINLASSGWNIVLISIDTANNNYNIIVNGVAGTNSTSIGNSQFDLAAIGSGPCNLKASNAANTNEPFAVSYFSAAYIDFSQESNRLKFVDALGYPVDLTTQIEAGDIPTPLIHMKFESTTSLGTNSGSGGDFTVNGTVTSGSDVEG